MLWFQTRHSKSSFLSPILCRVWVLSLHIIGSAWFLFHWRALSKVQTVIYLVSSIPRLAHPSLQHPLIPPSHPHPSPTSISALWQAYSDSRPCPWVSAGPGRRVRKDEKNTIDCLGFIRALQHWFDIREQRHRWHFRWLPRVLGGLACGYFFVIAFSPRLHALAHSYCLEFRYSVQQPPKQCVADFSLKS